MKTLTAVGGLILSVSMAFAQGMLNFGNSSGTLISVDGNPMPVSGTHQYIFAIFLAPSSTVTSGGQFGFGYDSAFQTVAAYNTNTASAVGRISTRSGLDVTSGTGQGFGPGSTVDFLIRGWDPVIGYTWDVAKDYFYFTASAIGISYIGNDLVLGGDTGSILVPNSSVFGVGSYQIPGFGLVTMPEPSVISIVLAGLALSGLVRRR